MRPRVRLKGCTATRHRVLLEGHCRRRSFRISLSDTLGRRHMLADTFVLFTVATRLCRRIDHWDAEREKYVLITERSLISARLVHGDGRTVCLSFLTGDISG